MLNPIAILSPLKCPTPSESDFVSHFTPGLKKRRRRKVLNEREELGVVGCEGLDPDSPKSQVKAHTEELQMKGEISGEHVKHHFLIRNRI